MRRIAFTLAVLATACGTDPSVRSYQGMPADGDPAVGGDDTSGDAGTTTPDGDTPDGDTPDHETPVTAATPLAQCEATAQWTAGEVSYWMMPTWLGFVGDGALVMGAMRDFSSTLMRVDEGTLLGWPSTDTILDITPDGGTALLVSDDAITVRDLVTGADAWRRVSEPWAMGGAHLSDDGDTVALTGCDGNGAEFITAIRRSTGVERTWIVNPEQCYAWSWSPNQSLAVGDGFVLAGGPDGNLIRYDLASGDQRSVVAHAGSETEDPAQLFASTGVLAVLMNPAGTEVVTSGLDGLVRRWSLPDLAPVGTPIASSWRSMNLQAYAVPWAASPLAFSHDGGLLAYIDPDGRPALLDYESGVLHDTLALREDSLTDPPPEFSPTGGVAAMAFSAGDDALATLDMLGMTLFACDPLRPSPPTSTPRLTMTAPATARIGEAVPLDLRVSDAPYFAGVRLLVDGVSQGVYQGSLPETWYPWEVGEFVVRVEVDDGRVAAGDEVRITVLPQP